MGIHFSSIRIQMGILVMGLFFVSACRESREIFAEVAPPKKITPAVPKPTYKKTFNPRPGFEPFDGIDRVPVHYTFLYEPTFITQKPIIRKRIGETYVPEKLTINNYAF